ncbi:hypothetical protein [Massilia sp. Root1485]|uniref:hypothetical protein n=1 Tax=Massilia sp. Root1485 TaxID=1736472 RepID=UPI0012E35FEE|nr:hypothetical protein [Massilia sp. Root1485]
MDASIRLRRSDEQIAARGRPAEEIMLEVAQAAREFKYLLDVQPTQSLFNPGGKGDARDSASYARASRLLDEANHGNR